MRFLKFLANLFGKSNDRPGATISLVMATGYSADKPIPRVADLQLSDHYTLFDLTRTNNAALQSENRILSDNQVQKLTKLSRRLEGIGRICGKMPRVHSAYRCLALNGATIGSSSTSQHPECEAVDFDIEGQTLDDTFTKLRAEAAAGRLVFGQLIRETADRGHTVSEWIHISETTSLAQDKIGQVLRMVADPEGKPHYELIEKLIFEHLTV